MLDKSIFYLFLLGVIYSLMACESTSSSNNDKVTNLTTMTTYTEAHRPQFHFSPAANWMNDPNGMVYDDGEYHLFYQYYPDSTVWGPMHWGHAISRDLVHWEHLPIALYPDSLGYIFSGSAVIDWKNTSGLGENNQPPMIAIFTHHDIAGERAGTKDFQYQSIAYSNDRGRSWTKYAGNPVIPNPGIKDFRDPKVIWHEPTQRWIMVFAVYDKVQIYTSPNLLDWTYASEFGIPGDTRLWECPDLFPLQVTGTDETKWVLLISIQKQAPNGGTATGYFIGDFDGRTFRADYREQYWADYGTDNYAMVTWSDIPATDGRRLALGWMSNWQYAQEVPTEKWRSAMTLPRSLHLFPAEDGYRLRSLPVAELAALEQSKTTLSPQAYTSLTTIVKPTEQTLYRLQVTFAKPEIGTVGLRFSNPAGEYLDITYAADSMAYFIDRRAAGRADFNENFAAKHRGEIDYQSDAIVWDIYLDHASVELFADEGQCVMTDIFFPQSPFNQIEVIAEGTTAELLSGQIIPLNRIW